jgi:hypothetical protein
MYTTRQSQRTTALQSALLLLLLLLCPPMSQAYPRALHHSLTDTKQVQYNPRYGPGAAARFGMNGSNLFMLTYGATNGSHSRSLAQAALQASAAVEGPWTFGDRERM